VRLSRGMPKKQHQHVVFKEPPRAAKKAREAKEPVDESKKFWFSTRDIAKFAADGSDRKTKKKYELFQLKQAGALPSKTLKTPLPILRGMRQKHGERMKRKREEEIEMGIFDKKKHLQQEQSFAKMDPLARAGKDWDKLQQLKMERGSRAERSGGDVDGERGIRASVGSFKNGVLHVNESNPLGLKAKAPKMLKAREMYKPEGKTFKGKFDKKFASKRASGGKKKKKRR
jgi:hypothetical protein